MLTREEKQFILDTATCPHENHWGCIDKEGRAHL